MSAQTAIARLVVAMRERDAVRQRVQAYVLTEPHTYDGARALDLLKLCGDIGDQVTRHHIAEAARRARLRVHPARLAALEVEP